MNRFQLRIKVDLGVAEKSKLINRKSKPKLDVILQNNKVVPQSKLLVKRQIKME